MDLFLLVTIKLIIGFLAMTLIIIHSGEENPKFPIITDGQLQNDILKVIGKDEKWLLAELKKQGVDKYSDVFLGEYVDRKLKLTTYK